MFSMENNKFPSKEENNKDKFKKALESWGEKNGNTLVFFDNDLKQEDKFEIKEDILAEFHPNKEVKYFANVLKNFLEGPIFTDSFHKLHRDLFKVDSNNKYRFDWEQEHEKELTLESLDFYKSNRLNLNRCSHVIGVLSFLKDFTNNLDLKNKLINLENKVPSEFLKKNKEGIVEYNFLDDAEKIRVVRELTEVVKGAIILLTEK